MKDTMILDRVLTIGPTGMDIIVYLPPLSSSNIASSVQVSAGGVCRNLALNLSTLGVDTTLLTQDYGSSLLGYETLSESRIAREIIPTEGTQGASIGVFSAVITNEDVVACAGDYSFATSVFNEATAQRFLKFINSFEIIVACSDVSLGFWQWIGKYSSRKRRLTCLITSGLPLPENYFNWFQNCDLLFINHEEVNFMGLDPETFCLQTVNNGVKRVFVTLGKEGGAWFCGEGTYPRRMVATDLPGRIVSPVGAGDAFAAGVIQGVLLGHELEQCVKSGLLLATLKLTRSENVLPANIGEDELRISTIKRSETNG